MSGVGVRGRECREGDGFMQDIGSCEIGVGELRVITDLLGEDASSKNPVGAQITSFYPSHIYTVLPYMFRLPCSFAGKKCIQQSKHTRNTLLALPDRPPIRNVTILRILIVPKASVIVIRQLNLLLLHLQERLHLAPPVLSLATRLQTLA